jgi:hypothetical protein
VADGDRAAIGVQPLVGDLEAVELVGQLAQDRERDGRVGLVDLPHVDVLRREAGSRERLGDRKGRRDPHDLRVQRIGCRGDNARQRLHAKLLGRCGAGEHDRAGAVVQRRGVAGGHLRRVGLRGQGRELVCGCVVADALVVLERARGLLAGGWDLDGMDLLRQPARVACTASVLVGAQRKRVDLLARELVAVGNVLCCLHHFHIGVARQQLGVGRAACASPHGVEHEDGAARHERRFTLHERPARPGHRLDAARQTDVELAATDRVGDLDRARQRGGAEAVDGGGWHRVGKAGRQRGPACDVPHPLVRRVYAAGGDVLDAVERYPHALAGPGHRLAEQVIDAQVALVLENTAR